VIARRPRGLLRALAKDRRGASAVEFALMIPFLLIVYLGGVQTFQAVAAYRKLSDATVELANVTAQYQALSSTDLANIFSATSQIMTPYPTGNMTMVLSIIKTNASNSACVYSSTPYNGGTALRAGAAFTPPAGLMTANSTYILVQTSYLFTPTLAYGVIGNTTMTDHMYMEPRNSATITVAGGATCP
jgi:Flp pilus assembly protein TadG